MCETCLHTNASTKAKNYDPTHTITLRGAFVKAMNKRFNMVAKAVTKTVVEDDAFGLRVTNEFQTNAVQSAGRLSFAFKSKDEKIRAFLKWLHGVEDAAILEMNTTAQYGIWTSVPWFDVYLAHAYKQGSDRAKEEMRKQGLSYSVADMGGTLYMNPISLEALRVIFTRAYTDLQGVTNTMDEQISRILAQGLFEGQAPMTLARMINSAIIGGGETLGMDISYINRAGNQVSYFMSGKRRAEILARTEIIRAHHLATIQEYRNWGVQGVYVLAEWATAGDDRVCPECASLQGRVFTLDEIEGMIPLHPQCRCISLPYVDKTRTITGG